MTDRRRFSVAGFLGEPKKRVKMKGAVCRSALHFLQEIFADGAFSTCEICPNVQQEARKTTNLKQFFVAPAASSLDRKMVSSLQKKRLREDSNL
jgi:hypothetical protein